MSGVHSRPVDADAARRVRALLEGGLTKEQREEAIAHLRACEACAELYDRIAEAEHRAAGSRGVLGAPALLRVAERLGLESATTQPGREASPRRRAFVPALAAIAALLLVVVVATLRPSDDFTPRGGPSPAPGVGLRLFRLSGAGNDVAAAELPPAGAVRRGERLGVSYTNLGAHRHATWVVIAPGAPPRVLDEVSGFVQAGVVDEPLENSIAVDDRFPVGPARIAVVFSDDAIPPPELPARLAEGEVKGIDVVVLGGAP